MGAASSALLSRFTNPALFRNVAADEIGNLVITLGEDYYRYKHMIERARIKVFVSLDELNSVAGDDNNSMDDDVITVPPRGGEYEDGQIDGGVYQIRCITGGFLLDYCTDMTSLTEHLRTVGIVNTHHQQVIITKFFLLKDRLTLLELLSATGGSVLASSHKHVTWKNTDGWRDNYAHMDHWYGLKINSFTNTHDERINEIHLAFNGLTGVLPDSLSTMTELQGIIMTCNKLSGCIPVTFQELKQLKMLYLDDNQLTGSIPSGLGCMKHLLRLHLCNNQLSGPLPWQLGLCQQLMEFNVHNNQLSGSIPSSYAQLKKLINLNLSFNKITGSIPEWIGEFENLQRLNLSDNGFTGIIPPHLSNLHSLVTLSVANNGLSGEIPESFGQRTLYTKGILKNPHEKPLLSNLAALDVSGNALSGRIPANLGNLVELRYVSFRGNKKLQANAPEDFPANLLRISQGRLVETKLSESVSMRAASLAYAGVKADSEEFQQALHFTRPMEHVRKTVVIGQQCMLLTEKPLRRSTNIPPVVNLSAKLQLWNVDAAASVTTPIDLPPTTGTTTTTTSSFLSAGRGSAFLSSPTSTSTSTFGGAAAAGAGAGARGLTSSPQRRTSRLRKPSLGLDSSIGILAGSGGGNAHRKSLITTVTGCGNGDGSAGGGGVNFEASTGSGGGSGSSSSGYRMNEEGTTLRRRTTRLRHLPVMSEGTAAGG